MSLSTWKRRLRDYGLGRNKNLVNEDMLKELIRVELNGPRCMGGYRSVWQSLHLVRTVERGVGGVGGPGPAKIEFYEKIEYNFEIDYFVFFHYSQKPLYSIYFRKNKVYLVSPELGDYGTLVIKTVLGVSDTYWGPVL